MARPPRPQRIRRNARALTRCGRFPTVHIVEKQSHVEVVEAPIEVCFDTIVDFAHYPMVLRHPSAEILAADLMPALGRSATGST
jgi:hypothetical protein